jgi:beta-glucosidase-like glycosyl hydrolase
VSDASERIGQVIWPALRASRGEAGLDTLASLAEEFPLGGVIVFGEGEARVDRLIAQLRLRIPGDLLVAADLERGCGQQVCEFTSLPPAMAIAACADPSAAHEAGLLTALEAVRAGIDVVFAPVADVNTARTNPIIATRSFGDDPQLVASLASAFAAGLAEGGVIAVAKHFPGHGSTVQDSHEQLARVTRDEAQLHAIDLVPFRTLIAEGVGGLMVGHLEVPALDPVPGRPATASPNVVLDHLRSRLGYDGLVVTDALDMGGFRSEPAAGLDVLHSGLDVLLMPADPLATARSLDLAHGERRLPDEVLDAAVGRIEAARRRVRDHTGTRQRPSEGLAEQLLANSITSRGGPLPRLQPGVPVDVVLYGEDDSGMVLPAFLEALEAEGIPRETGGRPLGLVITSVRAWAGSARLSAHARERLHWAAENQRLDMAVVLGSPYELLELPEACPSLLAYEGTPSAARQVVQVLCGRGEAPGTLPVGRAAP